MKRDAPIREVTAPPKKQNSEFFPDIEGTIKAPSSKNPLAFKYYNAEEEILGKKMKDWLRFSVAYWHTWRGTGADMFGEGTISRKWRDEGKSALENALKLVDVHAEFMIKLGIEYFCFHDRDIAPDGASRAESEANLDKVVAKIKKVMEENPGKIKLLWGTSNLFSHKRFMNGAATNPDPKAFAYAAAQVKKTMEITKYLGGENYVFWGGREGYQTLLNTNMRKELDHLALFLKMAVDYKNKIGFTGQLLIEPKPREPTKHQYDFDVAAVVAFLKTYRLGDHYKVNIESNHATLAGHTFEHELTYASAYGYLGSVDANSGDTLLGKVDQRAFMHWHSPPAFSFVCAGIQTGWDTDQFPHDVRSCTLAMDVIVKQGGLGSGGLNFDSKLRRESTDDEDLFISHISGMDCLARGLRNVAKMHEDGILQKMVEKRYEGWTTGIGAEIESGKLGFEELSQLVLDDKEDVEVRSGKQELYEMALNSFV